MLKHLKTFEKLDFNKVNTALFSPGFLEYYEALRDTGLFKFKQIIVEDGQRYDHLVFAPIVDHGITFDIEKFDLFVEDDHLGKFICIEHRSKDLIELDGLESMFNYIMNRSEVLHRYKNMKNSKDIWKILIEKNPKYIEECPKDIIKDIDFPLKPLSKTGIFN